MNLEKWCKKATSTLGVYTSAKLFCDIPSDLDFKEDWKRNRKKVHIYLP